MLLSLYLTLDLDDNPMILENIGNTLIVKNKNGKMLWTKNMLYYFGTEASASFKGLYQKIVDLDDNGRPEILLIGFGLVVDSTLRNDIVCYNAN